MYLSFSPALSFSLLIRKTREPEPFVELCMVMEILLITYISVCVHCEFIFRNGRKCNPTPTHKRFRLRLRIKIKNIHEQEMFIRISTDMKKNFSTVHALLVNSIPNSSPLTASFFVCIVNLLI